MGSRVRLIAVFALLAGGIAPAATTATGGGILFVERNRLILLDPSTGERTDYGTARSYDWSRDGSRIAYVDSTRLWTMNADGSERRELAPQIPNVAKAEWSPDGTKVAFVEIRPDRRTRLFVVGADGAGLRLVIGGVEPTIPRWSPDGRRLLFRNRIRPYTWALFIVDLESQRIQRVASPLHPNAVADWSPNGRLISFVERRRRLNVVRPDGRGRRRISNLVVWGVHAWSRDGSRIAFESQRYLSSDIWTVRPDGSQPQRLTRASEQEADDIGPDWSSDGAKIAFTSDRVRRPVGLPRDLYVMNADGSCETKLTADAEVSVAAPAWWPPAASGPAIRCHDVRLENYTDVEADRVSRNDDRVYLYQVDVLNEGSETAHQVDVRLSARPAGVVTFLSGTAQGVPCAVVAGEVACTLASVTPGEPARVVARFQARNTREPPALQARATTVEPDVDPAGNQAYTIRYFPFCRSTDESYGPYEPPFERELELVCGCDVADTISGSAVAEAVHAAGGADRVSGNSGNDRLGGENGNDNLFGGAGRDYLSGGSGHDRLHGGGGADGFGGGSGNDVILARDGLRDDVYCGRGRDTVLADAKDTVHRGCEVVRRG